MTHLLPGVLFLLFVLLPAIPTYTLIVQVSGRSGAWLFVPIYAADAVLIYGLFLLLADVMARWAYRHDRRLEDAARRWAKSRREEDPR